MIPKASGGVRPIGLFTGLHRIWAKARRPLADSWEKEHREDFFAAATGQSAIDTVWRQALAAEQAVHSKNACGAVLVDLSAFFEHLDHEVLWDRALDANFPEPITRLAVASYRAPRHITQDGRIAPPLAADRGVIAGCGLATTWVKVYCWKPLKQFTARHPQVTLDAYIDDFTLSAKGADEKEVRKLLSRAAKDSLR